MIRSFQFLGQELGQYVTDWGSIDDTKDLLLAQTQLFAGQYQIKLAGADKMFSPYYPTSLFYGRVLENQLGTVSIDGQVAYNGLVKSLDMDGQTREVTLTMENYFSKPTLLAATLTDTGANPAAAMLSLFENAGLLGYLDVNSFQSAGAEAAAAGATIGCAWDATGTTTVLSAVQAISQLSSISVYVKDGLIRAQAWVPYQGNGSGIKGTLTSSLVRNWSTFTQAYDNLNNVVTIGYGASSSLTIQDSLSILQNGVSVNYSFQTNTGSLTVPDLTSAQYFGQLFLKRASTLRSVVECTAGPELLGARLGDRWYVTAPNFGMTDVPMEIIETHQQLLDSAMTLKLATI